MTAKTHIDFIEISNYYLDINKVSKLGTDDERIKIHEYYSTLLSYSSDATLQKQAGSILLTLVENGFLKTIEKEEEILKS